jgi:4-hydroxybenzoate polyprenyltransferase
VPVHSLWREALLLLLSLAPGAAWVSLLNDLTDREDDLRAGKRNHMVGRSPLAIAFLLGITMAAGVAFCILWRDDLLLLALYLAAWIAFGLYSVPPFRLKTRGLSGVLCDASGSNLLPTLVGVTLVFRAAGRTPDVAWFVAVGTWALANGVRGILWHQLTDHDNDVAAGVRTFAERHSPALTVRLGTYFVFPLEILAMAATLWMIGSISPILALAVYVGWQVIRRRRWRINIVIVKPKPEFRIAMHEFYDTFLPLSLLVASAVRHPADLTALAVHLLLFPRRLMQLMRELHQLLRERGLPV